MGVQVVGPWQAGGFAVAEPELERDAWFGKTG
jgi:hypothetical protein